MSDDMPILGYMNMMLRHRRMIAALAAVTVMAAVALSFVRAPDYVAESKFTAGAPSSSARVPAALGSLAGAFDQGGSESLDFYAALLRSRTLLGDAAGSRYPVVEDGDTTLVPLARILDAERGDPTAERRAVAAELARRVTTTTDRAAGIITLRIQAPSAAVAVGVSNRLLELVEEFNREKRRSRAAEERKFSEARAEEAKQELDAAEAELARFLEQNRHMDLPPQLALDRSRLERKVELQQALFVDLQRSLQQARITEVRDAPVITVVERADQAVRRRGSGTLRNALLGLFLGLLLGITLAFLRERLRREPLEHPREYAEFRRLSRATLADVTFNKMGNDVDPGSGAPATRHGVDREQP